MYIYYIYNIYWIIKIATVQGWNLRYWAIFLLYTSCHVCVHVPHMYTYIHIKVVSCSQILSVKHNHVSRANTDELWTVRWLCSALSTQAVFSTVHALSSMHMTLPETFAENTLQLSSTASSQKCFEQMILQMHIYICGHIMYYVLRMHKNSEQYPIHGRLYV